jgi:predicted MPP superfamily phosphohydrolase
MLLFLPIIFGTPLLGVLWWFWADRKFRCLKHSRRWRIAAGLFAATMLCGFIWVLLARRLHIAAMPPVPILSAVYLWHLLILPSTLLVAVVVGTILAIRKIVRMLCAEPADIPNPNRETETGPTRREVISAAAAGLPPLVTAGLVGIALPQLNDFRLVERDVPVADLPPELEGLTLAHVSDVHIGKYTRGHVLEEIVEKVNAMSADLAMFSGDLIDFSMKDLPRGIEMIKAMRARHGLFMCEGNHDLFEDRPGFERQVKNAGLALLLDEAASLSIRGKNLQILGLRWGGGGAFIDEDLDAVMSARRPDAFPMLLAHHPHAFDAAAERRIPLTLAGHTHGGQLMLTRHAGAGPMLFRYWSGLYRKASGASLVVSNGVGNWFPLRVRAPAEIVKLTLKRG